ncbi:MAG: hypothetical protein RMJ53_05185 [Chitinophagales bacterium]|nr:hypothetical protein [Chitinophagales bacterium]MDW8273607.1 hypothetical protein [Chitinophagales bacterium]
MKKILLLFSVFILLANSSCKKCITCSLQSQRCAECNVQGIVQNICEGSLPNGVTLEQIVSGITLTGGTCEIKQSTPLKEEKFCWTGSAGENTAKLARITLEDKGYTCTDK